ncbi:Protein KAKU4 [Carex littledalei]|uniref:Protein KAKU4 n=1 Tax=Carex littledalei TaxID=544730 RepID=A0A833V9C1_9POAL|nr:Protein KAKU4 [Carex littledalei]
MQPGGEGEHPPRSNGDGWINGLLTGAERFLNAVLGSDTPSSSSSSTSGSVSSEEKGVDASLAISTTRNGDLNQMERDPKMVDCLDEDLAVVSEINSKQAIEQLLMEETFSREECNNLVDLIQSRVIDSDEQPITCEKDKTPPLNLGSSLLSPKFLSLGSSPYHTRNLEYTAINEAKKWLDAEKSPEGGPCMLNTNQLEFDPETGSSPVELAKAYMNSLPQKNCAKVFKRGCESPAFGLPPEKRVKLMVIAGSLDIPKFKQLDVNSSVQSSYQAQASIGVNDTPILTAIPLDPVDLHVSKSYKTYDCSSKVPHKTDQLGNAWVPYATCAMDVPENRPGGCDPPIKMCAASKLIINEGDIMAPNTSLGTRGGRARRGRRKSGTGNGVARNSCCGITNENGTKESQQKSPTPRPRRGRRAKLS